MRDLRPSAVGLALALLSASAARAALTVEHYGSLAEVQARIVRGFDFVAHADTANLVFTRADPPGASQVPFPLWNNGVPHAFKVVYNAGGIAGIAIDDLYTTLDPVQIDPETNGLLVTAFAPQPGLQVVIDNLKLTLPPFQVYDVPAQATAPDPDYMLITTNLPLTGGFILSGTVTFRWDGDLPPPEMQWFEVAPVVVPAPAAAALGLLALALCGATRRR